MSLVTQTLGLFGAFFTADNYYKALNSALRRFNDEFTMLHYPLFKKNDDSFFQSQKNLTDHCIALVDNLSGKSVLEIGCGNGVQACYVTETYKPAKMTGIDFNPASIEIANMEKERRNLREVTFHIDDAQVLKEIPSNSQDLIINIESAFHYPDKSAFLREIHRVLKPGGQFLIADLVTLKNKGTGLRLKWKKLQGLYHWSAETYEKEIQSANLQTTYTGDITEGVIRGFQSYPLWFSQMQKKGVVNDAIFKLFYYVVLQWYMFLLRNRRRYVVFAGVKVDNPLGKALPDTSLI